MAGVSELNKFGNFQVIDNLAGGNPLLYDEVEQLPYAVIFTKLLYNKTVYDYQKRLNKILSRQK